MNLKSILKSGAGSLYIRSGKDISIEKLNLETIISTKIKKVKIEVTYDFHATNCFTFDEILNDFWSMVYQICEEYDIEWR